MNAHTKRLIRKFLSPIRKIGLKNKDFSIISNNCWGGFIYDLFGLQYLTPTIGLFFYSDDYIKFLSNIKYYLSLEAVVIDPNESKHKKDLFEKYENPMVGRIGDIELVFVHYASAEEGCKKWNNRRNRVNFDNLLVKFNDQNQFTLKNLSLFDGLDFKNKIFFGANKEYCNNSYSYYFDEFVNDGYVVDDIKTSLKYVKIKKVINNLK